MKHIKKLRRNDGTESMADQLAGMVGMNLSAVASAGTSESSANVTSLSRENASTKAKAAVRPVSHARPCIPIDGN